MNTSEPDSTPITGVATQGQRLDALRSTLDNVVLPGALSLSDRPFGEISVVTMGESWALGQVTCAGIRVSHGAAHLGNPLASSLLIWMQTRGEAEFHQGARRIRCRPGELVVRDAALPSTVDVPARASGLILRLAKSDGLVGAEHLLNGRPARLGGTDGATTVIRGFLASLTDGHKGTADTRFHHARSTVAELLWSALSRASIPHRTDDRIGQIVDTVRRRARDPVLRAVDVADECGMSRRTLNGLLAKHGLTYRRLLRDIRLRMAKEALDQGVTVTASCFHSGFNDAAHFSRAFKAHFGTTPRGYRTRIVTGIPSDD